LVNGSCLITLCYMAHPPARILQTFGPVGPLQLHSLGKLVPFHCVRCQRDKMADLLATIDGNWSRIFCYRCYESFVSERQQKAKEPVNDDANKRQVELRKPRKVQRGQPWGELPAISEKKLRQLRRRLPGIDALLEFFSAAGVQVKLAHDGNLRINGRQIPPIRRLPPSGGIIHSSHFWISPLRNSGGRHDGKFSTIPQAKMNVS